MLDISNLHVAINDTPILRGLNLQVGPGEVHAIMGPNGAGKSTLSKVLLGNDDYSVTDGAVSFHGEDLLAVDIEDRARKGLYVSYQYPVEVPGVNNADFLRMALNAKRSASGQPDLDREAFTPLLTAALEAAEAPDMWRERDLNAGMSGGEKKRNEIVQMLLLEPSVAILDETDSGLDVDALRSVARGINNFRRSDRAVILITHYQRLLDLVEPDHVHILAEGRIVRSGDKSLATELEAAGYDGVVG